MIKLEFSLKNKHSPLEKKKIHPKDVGNSFIAEGKRIRFIKENDFPRFS